MLARYCAPLLLLFASPSVRAADRPAPLERADLDRRAAIAVYECTMLGSQIYNRGNHEGCYRIYQGTLITLLPLLDHHPKLAERVKESLDLAKAMRTPVESAFALREALDAVQAELTGGKPLPIKPLARPEVKKEPLWDRLGGEKAVRAVVHDFAVTGATDPKVNFTRGGKYPLDGKGMDRLEQRLVEMISAATGGPLKYTGRDMKEVHKGMAITNAEFTALVDVLKSTLKKFEVRRPEIEELLEIVGSTKRDIVEEK